MHYSALRAQRNHIYEFLGDQWSLVESMTEICLHIFSFLFIVVDISVGLCCFVCLLNGVIFTSCATLHQGLLLITTEIVDSSIRLEHELSWAASAVIKPGAWTLNQVLPGGVEADFHGLLCALLSSDSPRPAWRGQWSWTGCVWPSTAVCVLRSAWVKCSPHLGGVGFTLGKMVFN